MQYPNLPPEDVVAALSGAGAAKSTKPAESDGKTGEQKLEKKESADDPSGGFGVAEAELKGLEGDGEEEAEEEYEEEEEGEEEDVEEENEEDEAGEDDEEEEGNEEEEGEESEEEDAEEDEAGEGKDSEHESTGAPSDWWTD